METFEYSLKIPKDRIAVLIGKDGVSKKQIEEYTSCKLDIDSKEGDVTVIGSDSVKLYMLKDVVKAVGRGFNPDVAMRLLKQDYVLELIDMSEFIKNKDQLGRVRGRVIGKNGKARERIEEFTECSLSVYGKTVAIIGDSEHIGIAQRAVESLIQGSPHTSVFKWLEKHRKKASFASATGF
jgi:ribosomal RNA assembly protein